MTVVKAEFLGYSMRRLNPFRGVVQIAQRSGSRALSFDGDTWEIQVRARRPDDMWGADSAAGSTLQYLRFGTWSPRDGIRKVPAHPLLDMTAMLEESRRLVDCLAESTPAMPFPLRDRFELWLLDGGERAPLALIGSSVDGDRLPLEKPYRWQCAAPSSPDFSAPDWDETHPLHPRDRSPTPHIDALNRVVAIESGHALAQWFERLPGGEGRGLPVPGIEGLDGRVLPGDAFPDLLVRERWSDCYEGALVAGYIDWMSPLLLTLQNLPDTRRAELERQARRRAVQVEACWRFYPKIIDRGAIDAARVEARLIDANG